MPGPLTGRDDGVGIEEHEIAHQFLDRAVARDGVGAMLHMRIGEDPDPVGAKPRPIAHRRRRLAVEQALVGHIGIGPLVDPDEAGTAGRGDGQRRDRGIGQHVDADRLAEAGTDPVGHHGHMGRDLRADIAGFRERDVAVVLDDDAVEPAVEIGPRIG